MAVVRMVLQRAWRVATERFRRAQVEGRTSWVPKRIHHVTPRMGGEQETRQLTTYLYLMLVCGVWNAREWRRTSCERAIIVRTRPRSVRGVFFSSRILTRIAAPSAWDIQPLGWPDVPVRTCSNINIFPFHPIHVVNSQKQGLTSNNPSKIIAPSVSSSTASFSTNSASLISFNALL